MTPTPKRPRLLQNRRFPENLTSAESTRQADVSRAGKIKRKLLWALCLIVVLSGVGIASFSDKLGLSGRKNVSYLTQPLRRGPLDILLVERGSLDSANNITLNSEVEGASTIIKIIEEGKSVKPGDILVELDSSKFRDLQIQQQIQVEQAQAAFLQAKENKAIQETQNQSDIAAAQLALDVAEGELQQLREGDRIKQEFQLKGTIALAQEEVTRATEKYDFVKRNNKKGYYNQNDVETARIALEKAEFNLGLAEEDLKLYQEYTFRLLEKQKAAGVEEFRRAVDRAKLKASAAMAQVEATLKAAELTERVEKEKLSKYETQIAACTIKAPQPGEVVYANQNSDRRGSSEATIMEGATVRERQAIINLPDYSKMQVTAKIHESRIGLVQQGLPVAIRVDAVPGETFYGKVDTVSSVPISGNWRTPDLKEYSVIVKITDSEQKVRMLKPGLTAEVEIQVEKIPSALIAPVQAVTQWGGKHYVFRQAPGQAPEQLEVQVGRTNDVVIEIKDQNPPVKEGDLLVLNPRQLLPEEPPPVAAPADGTRPAEDGKQSAPPAGELASTEGQGGPGAEGGRRRRGQGEGRGEGRGPEATGSNGPAPEGRGPNGSAPEARSGGPGGNGGGGPGSGGQGGGGMNRDPAARFARMDADQNGKLEGDEISERMKPFVSMIDTNGDGAIDLEEMKQGASLMGRPGGGGPGGAGPGTGPGAPQTPQGSGAG